MKKWIFRIAGAAVVLLVVVLAVIFFSLNSIVKKGVETVGPQMTKVEVRLGSANLSPFSGNGQLSKLFIGNPEGYKTPAAIKLGDIKVGLQLSSLMGDTIVVEKVNIQAPEITLEGGLSGNNLSKILDNIDAASGSRPASKGQPPAAKSEKRFQVKDLVISGGIVNLNLSGLGAKTVTVPLPELHLQNIGTADNGVTAAELSKQIMKPLLASVTKVGAEYIANIGKGAVDQLNNSTKGLKDIFKK